MPHIDSHARSMGQSAESDLELAQKLGTDRKSLRRWRARFQGSAPQSRDVETWRKFMEANLLGRYSARMGYGGAPISGGPPVPTLPAHHVEESGEPSLNELRRQREAVRLDIEKTELGKERGELLIAAELEPCIGSLLATFTASLHRLPFTASRYLVGLRDQREIEHRLADEIDETLESLRGCVEAGLFATAEAVERDSLTCPVPDGISPSAWRPFLRDAVRDALFRIGARCIEDWRRSQIDGQNAAPAMIEENDGYVEDSDPRPPSKREAHMPLPPPPTNAPEKARRKNRGSTLREPPPAIAGAIVKERSRKKR